LQMKPNTSKISEQEYLISGKSIFFRQFK